MAWLLPVIGTAAGGRADGVTADEARQVQAVAPGFVRAVAWPGGKDVDWDKVQAVIAIIGAVTLLHGLRTRSWRYLHTATTVLGIGATVAGRLKDRYAEAARQEGRP
jgi:hypothetical protein